jgi:large subunit ribosomal protein L25
LEVNVVVDEVEVEALPSKLPREIKINVSNLKDGDTITVGDLKLPEGVKILSEESEVLVSVYNPAESQEESENTEENE